MSTCRAIAGLVLAMCVAAGQASAQGGPALLPHLTSSPPTFPSAPNDRLKRLETYTNVVELTISPLGKVIDCRVTSSNGPELTATSICEQLKSSQFSPAIDNFGKPSFGFISTSFSWPNDDSHGRMLVPDVDLTVEKLPVSSPIHPIVELALVVDDRGHVEHCTLAKSSGVTSLDSLACKLATSGAAISPTKSEAGVPVRSVRSYFVGFGVYAQLVLKHDFSYAAYGDPGPYYPDRAARMGVSGYATLDCVALASGALTSCLIDEEFPMGFGFGPAALTMAKTNWMQVPVGSGGHVLVRVDFPHIGRRTH